MNTQITGTGSTPEQTKQQMILKILQAKQAAGTSREKCCMVMK